MKANNSLKLNNNRAGLSARFLSSDQAQCYMLLALPIIGFFVFTLYPIVWSAAKAFYFYNMVPDETKFVGFENFVKLFGDDGYWKAWVVTWEFLIYKLPIEIPLALILATVLSKGLRGSDLIRNLYYLPCVISVAIVGIIFSNIFDAFGVINAWLSNLGLINGPIDWFGKTGTAMAVLVAGGIWSQFGTNVVYFTAALSNVPLDLYEAADIEGAGTVTKFFKITIPMISKVFQTILLMAINGTLRVGEYILVLTNGAPAKTTLSAEAYLMKSFLPGFADGQNPNVGYGCCMAIVSSIICMIVGLLYMQATKKIQDLY